MRYTILFIITLVFVSGFIAYFGDFLGRKMGKKRLTLLGLRPRHTAIFVTTITGMVIAILTLATITGISTSIREVLVAGEQKIAQSKQLTKENKALSDTNQRLRIIEQKFRKDYEEAKKARDAAAKKVSDLTDLIAFNVKELNDLKTKKNATEAQLAAKGRMLQSLEKELRSMQAVLAETNEKLHKAQVKLAGAEKELANSFRIAEEQRRTIESQRGTIDSQQKAMDEINRQIEDQQAVLVKLGKENLMWLNGIARLKTQDVVLKQGQEILRQVVAQDQSYYSIRSDILSILEKASEKAKESGASAGKNERAVMLVPPTPESNEQECISTVAELIGKSATPVMVQVVVFSNTLKGEAAPVHLQLFRNDLAFAKGKTLALGKIDGRQTEGRILLAVVSFLRNEVRKAADDAGVVPVASPEPEIQGEQLDELMDLVSKIKKVNAPVGVRVSAERDIYAAGPLNLRSLEFAISTSVASASSGSR